jgi:hypothetical protein
VKNECRYIYLYPLPIFLLGLVFNSTKEQLSLSLNYTSYVDEAMSRRQPLSGNAEVRTG